MKVLMYLTLVLTTVAAVQLFVDPTSASSMLTCSQYTSIGRTPSTAFSSLAEAIYQGSYEAEPVEIVLTSNSEHIISEPSLDCLKDPCVAYQTSLTIKSNCEGCAGATINLKTNQFACNTEHSVVLQDLTITAKDYYLERLVQSLLQLCQLPPT
jgi:ABC-type multidrug transport system fused ATPase/permease subunit